MRYIVVNDPHIDIHAPSSRRNDDYMVACFKKLEAITQLLASHQATALVCTGDWFHKKNPQAVPHRLTRALVNWSTSVTQGLGVPILTTLGNHDTQFNDLSVEAVRKQPVSLLLEVPGVVRLRPDVAWVQDGVAFVGSDYRPDLVQEDGSVAVDLTQFDIAPECAASHDMLVQVTHASVLPHAVMWPHVQASVVAERTLATICHTGHIHEDLGVHRFAKGDGFVYWTNVGSMTRGSLTEETIAREPKVLLVEVEPGEAPRFTELTLPHVPAAEIYDVQGYREAKSQDKAFASWTEQLKQEIHATSSPEASLQTLVMESSLDLAARDLALRLLNDVGV